MPIYVAAVLIAIPRFIEACLNVSYAEQTNR